MDAQVVGTVKRRVGSLIGATEARYTPCRPWTDGGAFRYAIIDNPSHPSVVYKVEYSDGETDNIREYEAMAKLAACGCGIAQYIPPTTLYYIDGRYIIAMPYYQRDGRFVDTNTRREFVRCVRNHNVHCDGIPVMDLLDGNYRLDRRGKVRLTDANLDPNDYEWLIETDSTGRMVGTI